MGRKFIAIVLLLVQVLTLGSFTSASYEIGADGRPDMVLPTGIQLTDEEMEAIDGEFWANIIGAIAGAALGFGGVAFYDQGRQYYSGSSATQSAYAYGHATALGAMTGFVSPQTVLPASITLIASFYSGALSNLAD